MKRLAPGEFIGRLELKMATRSGVVVLGGHQVHIEPHEHSDTHLVLVTEGAYRTSAAGVDRCIGKGGLLINSPGTRHDDQFEGSGRYMAFSLADWLLDDLECVGWTHGPARSVQSAAPAGLMLGIATEASRFDEVSELEIEGLACELVASLSVDALGGRTEPAWLGRVEDMIEASTELAPSVAALAREARVHPVYLARAFRKFRGQTPGAMVRLARAKRAAKLLARSREPITEIALECGFADQASFTKAFTRATSFSPLAFRRRWRQ